MIPRLREEESDLLISAEANYSSTALSLLRNVRHALRGYIEKNPDFTESLLPLTPTPDMPPVVMSMCRAARRCGVGPMAAVAGAIADFVGQGLAGFSPEIIVENGGDVYLHPTRERIVGLYAGEENPISSRLGLLCRPRGRPWGIASSSGTLGRSLSFGKADLVVTIAEETALADAAATAIANRVYDSSATVRSIAITFARSIKDLEGCLIIFHNTLEIWGNVELVELRRQTRSCMNRGYLTKEKT